MKKLKQFISEFSIRTDYEKILLRIKSSMKGKDVSQKKYQVIKDCFSGLNPNISPQEAFKVLYSSFRNCNNQIALTKIVILVSKLTEDIPSFSELIETDKLFRNQNPVITLNTSRDVLYNLLTYYLRFYTSYIESFEYHQLVRQDPHSFALHGQFRNNMAISIALMNQLKLMKNLLQPLDYMLTRHKSQLFETFAQMVLSYCTYMYGFVAEFVGLNCEKILLMTPQGDQELQLLYQLYKDVIQVTSWVKKLFALQNLFLASMAEEKQPRYFVVNADKNKKFELTVQQSQKYDYPSPVESPLLEKLAVVEQYERKEMKENKKVLFRQFSLVSKGNEIQTQLAHSDRPLTFNNFSEIP